MNIRILSKKTPDVLKAKTRCKDLLVNWFQVHVQKWCKADSIISLKTLLVLLNPVCCELLFQNQVPAKRPTCGGGGGGGFTMNGSVAKELRVMGHSAQAAKHTK